MQNLKGRIGIFIGIILVLVVVLIFIISSTLSNQPRSPKPTQLTDPTNTISPNINIPSTQLAIEEESIIASFEENIPTSGLPLDPNERFLVKDVRIQDDWAFIEATLVDIDTGDPFVGGGTIILLRKVDTNWEPAFPGTDIYKEWLDEVPESLVPNDLKIFLR